MTRFRAVLFDVGGPIDMEVRWEQVVDRDMRAALTAAGVEVDDAAFAEASQWAVEVFAPDAYGAILWRLCGADAALFERVMARFRDPAVARKRAADRGGLELRPGIAGLLEQLAAHGLLLALAANQPVTALDDLDRLGVGQYFQHRELTGHHGYRKPDVRLFLRACEDLGVEPAECIMVGDRVDNDITPANLLGMTTVLFRTGRHRHQQPRMADEVATVEVESVEGLQGALDRLLAQQDGYAANRRAWSSGR